MHHKISVLILALLVTGPCFTLDLTPDEKIRYDGHCKRREENRAFSPNKSALLATEFRRSSKLAFNYKPEEEKLTLDLSLIQRDYKAIGASIWHCSAAIVGLISTGSLLNSAINEAHALGLLTALCYRNASYSYKQCDIEQNKAETDRHYHRAIHKASFDFHKNSNGKWQLVSAVDNQEIKSRLENLVNNYDLDHYIGVEDLESVNEAFTAQQG